MAAIGNETQPLESSPNNLDQQYHLQPHNDCKIQTPKISLYEQSREERIKENLQRMQQLGLKDLSNSLLNSTPRLSSRRGRPRVGGKPPVTPLSSPLPSSDQLRRSSRLQNTTPVIYSEAVSAKKEELFEDVELKLGKSEVYTEAHEKLLGNTERSWTLFVDGYGRDGRRIYDSVKGKTCHQCRQKTLGHRTNCSKCNMVQGQFCGDCLYMRYGEHVLEANENPNWVCPVCRGICNCSLCRQAKGWAPTGSLYRKVTKMGFKSVAHYLIQTRHVQTNVEKNSDNTDQVSAKRSLSFPAPELPSEESPAVDNNQLVTSKPQSGEDGLSSEKKEQQAYPEPNTSIIHQNPASKPLLFSKNETEFEKGESTKINLDFGNKRDDEFICQHEKELDFTDKEPVDSPVTLETRPEKKHASSSESTPGSIAGRLKQVWGSDRTHDETVLDGAGKNVDVGYAVSESSPNLIKRPASAIGNSLDSNAAKLKQRRQLGKDCDEQGLLGANGSVSDEAAENISSRKESKANLKHCTSGTNMDCIARRLRPRNKAL
ncbi:hypothetical protein ERO13_A11G189000v2 [Gossypium hirsutum]|uniref:Zinc-finger domain-containing protein n=1 Tax=Gossypium hirsutum TaxID=3635 RepID=A0A1U8IID8_GOSHI|nr:uncharacterized protein LOC107897077 [Gossypium hirsutum]KAG4175498.1 hypothetical protein ERO13_A11G189000v2 [Gossypium hirsutum]